SWETSGRHLRPRRPFCWPPRRSTYADPKASRLGSYALALTVRCGSGLWRRDRRLDLRLRHWSGTRRLRRGIRPLGLHVAGAAEVSPFGNRDARRSDVPFDRAILADVNLLGGGDVTHNLAKHHDRFREELCLDLAVGTNRQYVVAKLDLAL